MNIKIYDLKCSSYVVKNENYAGGKTKQRFIKHVDCSRGI